jgi:hypothetical protein
MPEVEIKSNDFNPIDILPERVIITSAGSHLYKIGLSLFPNGCVKRDKFHNPVFIFILNLLVLIRSIILLLLSDEYEYLFPYLGDFFSYFNVEIHGNLVVILFCLFSLISQIIHYYNYKNDTV